MDPRSSAGSPQPNRTQTLEAVKRSSNVLDDVCATTLEQNKQSPIGTNFTPFGTPFADGRIT